MDSIIRFILQKNSIDANLPSFDPYSEFISQNRHISQEMKNSQK